MARFWIAATTATVTTISMFILSVYSGWPDLGPRTMYISYFLLAEELQTDFLSAALIFDVISSSLLAFVVFALYGHRFRSSQGQRNTPRNPN